MSQLGCFENTQNFYDKMCLDHMDEDESLSIKWYILNEYAKTIEEEFLSEFIEGNVKSAVKRSWPDIPEEYKEYVSLDEEVFVLELVKFPKNIRITFQDIKKDCEKSS